MTMRCVYVNCGAWLSLETGRMTGRGRGRGIMMIKNSVELCGKVDHFESQTNSHNDFSAHIPITFATHRAPKNYDPETKQTVHSVVLPNLVLGSVTNSDTSFRCVCLPLAPNRVAVAASGTLASGSWTSW